MSLFKNNLKMDGNFKEIHQRVVGIFCQNYCKSFGKLERRTVMEQPKIEHTEESYYSLGTIIARGGSTCTQVYGKRSTCE